MIFPEKVMEFKESGNQITIYQFENGNVGMTSCKTVEYSP